MVCASVTVKCFRNCQGHKSTASVVKATAACLQSTAHDASFVTGLSEPIVLFCFICSGACASALRFKRAFTEEHHYYYAWRLLLFPVNRL
jgi:hypothetical protein